MRIGQAVPVWAVACGVDRYGATLSE